MSASPGLVIKDKETRVVLFRDRWAHKRSVRSSVVTAAMEHVSAISACRKCMVSSSIVIVIVIVTGIGKKPVGA